MTDTASPTVETPAREKKSASRIVTAIVRILLGLMFLVFGLNGFLNFMPAPKDIPPEIMNVMGALIATATLTPGSLQRMVRRRQVHLVRSDPTCR